MGRSRDVADALAQIPEIVEALAPVIEQLPDYVERLDAAEAIASAAGTAAGNIEAERVVASAEARLVALLDTQTEIIQDLIGGDGKVPTYTDPIMGVTLTDSPTIILPEDIYRIGGIIQSTRVDIAIGQGDALPDFDGQYHIIYAGAGVDSSIIQRKPIFAVARWPLGSAEAQQDPVPPVSVPLAVTVERLTAGDLPLISLGDRVSSYYADPVHGDYRAAIRTMINDLEEAGIYAKLGFLRIVGASLANDAINLANPTGPRTVKRDVGAGSGVLTHVPYLSVKGDGVAWLDTQTTPVSGKMAFDNHSMGVYPASAALTETTAIYSIGSTLNLGLQPNRSSTGAGYRSGTGLDNRTPVSPGSPISMSRRSATAYTQYLDGASPLEIARTVDPTPLTERSVALLAVNSSGGPSAATQIPQRAAWFGAGLSDAEHLTLRNAIRAVLDVCDEIRGGA